ncbi:LOW QUALITY PROTEIN: hypothetical protein V3C99_002792 [Haemonchus contortus]
MGGSKNAKECPFQVEFKHHSSVSPDKDYAVMHIDGNVEVIRLEPDSTPVLLKLRPLKAGDSFSIEGRINEDANKVDFNLYSSANPKQNVLHVNPRFYQNTTVINSYLDGHWGEEELAPLVFRRGESFTLEVNVYATYFEISCNGRKLHKYKHRAPYDGLDRIVIYGDCTVLGSSSNERSDTTLPLEMGFPGGSLKTNQSIILYGIPRGDRWTLELPGDDGDILFHFKALFKANAVIRNALFDGSWGKEEKEGPFPFKMGEPFSIVFQNTPYSIRITVNDELFGAFVHRTEHPEVDYKGMKVDGDLEVLFVDVE